jgi:hypothetical protein
MSYAKAGGPAFSTGNDYEKGMTLRDYFAAKAMQVLMAETNGQGDDNPGSPRWSPEEVSELAYSHADAMLVARD